MKKDPGVDGVTSTEFNAWKHHPVTKVFLKYAKDKREFIEKTAIDVWKRSGGGVSETMRGQVIELQEIEEIDFLAVAFFYGIQEEDNETESSQD